MGQPYLYKQYCPVCDCRMDPNADHLKAEDGESVCSQECKDEHEQVHLRVPFEQVFPLLAETNEMLRRITIRPKASP